MENEYEEANTVSRVAAESQSESLESGLTVESARGDADSKKLVGQPNLPLEFLLLLR